MYTCICGKHFDKAQSLSNHKVSCKEYLQSVGKNYNFVCNVCGKVCKTESGLLNHMRTHTANRRTYKIEKVQCEVCGKMISKNNLHSHMDKHNGIVRDTWNKGLTKDNDIRLAQMSETLKHLYKSETIISKQKNKPRTEEEKQKISQTMKNNPNAGGLRHGSGKGKKGWYNGFFCDSTYELVYVIYNLDHNIRFKRSKLKYQYEYNNEIHNYYPDFELEDGSLVEVKGYYNKQVEAKINSVNDRKITLLMQEDLQYAFEYVKENYTYDKLEDLYNGIKHGGL